jgi:hypothetical protein
LRVDGHSASRPGNGDLVKWNTIRMEIHSPTSTGSGIRTLGRKPMIAGRAAALGQQACRAIMFGVTQEAKQLTPTQSDQYTGISNRSFARSLFA